MKRRNFKLLAALAKKGMRQCDLVQAGKLKSNSRLSRIINYRADPTKKEKERICLALDSCSKELGF